MVLGTSILAILNLADLLTDRLHFKYGFKGTVGSRRSRKCYEHV